MSKRERISQLLHIKQTLRRFNKEELTLLLQKDLFMRKLNGNEINLKTIRATMIENLIEGLRKEKDLGEALKYIHFLHARMKPEHFTWSMCCISEGDSSFLNNVDDMFEQLNDYFNGTSYEFEFSWELHQEAIWAGIALEDLNKFPIPLPTLFSVVFLPHLPLIAFSNLKEREKKFFVKTVEDVFDVKLEPLGIRSRRLHTLFRFGLYKTGNEALLKQTHTSPLLKVEQYEDDDDDPFPEGVIDEDLEEESKQKDLAKQSLGDIIQPVLPKLSIKVFNLQPGKPEDEAYGGKPDMSVTFKGASVLEGLRHLIITGKMTKLPDYLKRLPYEATDTVNLGRRIKQ